MRKFLAGASLGVALAFGVALAGQNEPIVIQNETRIVTEAGQTFEITVTGISAEIVFIDVTETKVTGSVRRTGGSTAGTFRIYWHDTGKSQELRLTTSDPYKLFSLEGGDTDKKTGSQIQS